MYYTYCVYIILTYKGYHFSSFLLPRLPLHIGLQCKLQKVGTVATVPTFCSRVQNSTEIFIFWSKIP